ncbi:MAG: hypothetical protein PHE67_00125 [Campylobacterales bacterium]|nr:hypothetical protein [Campylobacterales bacterium]
MDILDAIKAYIYKKRVKEALIGTSTLEFKQLLNFTPIGCYHANDLEWLFDVRNYSNDDSCKILAEELGRLIIEHTDKVQQFDYRDLSALENSRTSTYYPDVYTFGAMCYSIHQSNWTLASCSQSITNRFKNIPYFIVDYFEWNKKYIWYNDDQSHHMATGIFLATRDNLPICFNTQITRYSLDKTLLRKILNNHYGFLMSRDTYFRLYDLFEKSKLNFDEFCTPILASGGVNMLIFLGKNKPNKFSDLLAKILSNRDKRYILDFNEYMEQYL